MVYPKTNMTNIYIPVVTMDLTKYLIVCQVLNKDHEHNNSDAFNAESEEDNYSYSGKPLAKKSVISILAVYNNTNEQLSTITVSILEESIWIIDRDYFVNENQGVNLKMILLDNKLQQLKWSVTSKMKIHSRL